MYMYQYGTVHDVGVLLCTMYIVPVLFSEIDCEIARSSQSNDPHA
jgi:hypothetical protein